MATALEGLVFYLRRVVAPSAGAGASDTQLLRRFAEERDESAFELLVWRHARMVLGACRRVLRDEHAAEDCFQAAFLALARQARTVGRSGSVGGWLHKVACRVALKARVRAARQRDRERPLEGEQWPSAQPEPGDVVECRELEMLLDTEVNRLPCKYREAFVLCVLAGKSDAEAARELGCPVGTVTSRLARARERLRTALARRGFAPSAGLLAPGAFGATQTGVPAPLVGSTVQAATLFAAGKVVAAGVVPAQVVALTRGVLRSMFIAKIKVAVLSLLVATALAAAGLTYQARAAQRVGDRAVREAPERLPWKPEAGKAPRRLSEADRKLLNTLLVLDKQWWEACARADRVTLGRLLADDYVALCYGRRYTRADTLRRLGPGQAADHKVTTPVEMVRLNAGAAVLSYEAKWKGLSPRGEVVATAHARVTVCWVQRGGGWFIVFCQETPVAAR
jgi:RNA polymerase sigma factor (sigma-70 family)